LAEAIRYVDARLDALWAYTAVLGGVVTDALIQPEGLLDEHFFRESGVLRRAFVSKLENVGSFHERLMVFQNELFATTDVRGLFSALRQVPAYEFIYGYADELLDMTRLLDPGQNVFGARDSPEAYFAGGIKTAIVEGGRVAEAGTFAAVRDLGCTSLEQVRDLALASEILSDLADGGAGMLVAADRAMTGTGEGFTALDARPDVAQFAVRRDGSSGIQTVETVVPVREMIDPWRSPYDDPDGVCVGDRRGGSAVRCGATATRSLMRPLIRSAGARCFPEGGQQG
jgi:hypothetical protein